MNPNPNYGNLADLVKQLAVNLATPASSPWTYQNRFSEEDIRRVDRLLICSETDRDRQLKSFLRSHRRLLGASLLSVLLRHPGTAIPATRLWDLLHSKQTHMAPEPGEEQPLLLETPISSCDSRTLSQVRQRHKQLREALERTDLSPEARLFLHDEKEHLERYLRASVAPGGMIRSIPTALHRTRRSLSAALSRLLQTAREEDPELAAYISAHLRTGKEFCWQA